MGRYVMKGKYIIKQLLPPILVSLAGRLLRSVKNESQGQPEWEYMPQGWLIQDPRIKDWNVQCIAEAQKARWPIFMRCIEGVGPLGVGHETLTPTNLNHGSHNIIMCYAYVLTLAARKKDRLTILDWGGGSGHYYPISKALLPDLEIEYHCYDVPLLCKNGRELLPDAYFHEKVEDVFQKKYDLIISSSSLQYFENWKDILYQLAVACEGYLFITRLPIVHKASSFVVVQRPYCHGYHTEYLSWVFNRQEFLKNAEGIGLRLIREFLIGKGVITKDAPERGETRGFLFTSNLVKEGKK